MKLVDIFLTASSNMMRSKLRSFLTIVAVFIGALTLTLTNGMGAGISTYIDKQLGNLGAKNVLEVQAKISNPFDGGPQEYDPNRTVSGNSVNGPGGMAVLTQKDIESIQGQPGIKSIEPAILPAPDYIQGNSDKKYKLTMQSFIDGTNIDIAAGKSLGNAIEARELIVPISYVELLGFVSNEAAVGEQVKIAVTSGLGEQQVVEATIVGVQQQTLLSTVGGAQGNKSLMAALNDIQTEGLPDAQKNQYIAAFATVDQNISDQDMQTIKDGLDSKGYTAATLDDQIGIFKQVIDAIIMVLNFFAGIALLAASFGIINTLLMAVQERTKEIGLMKAMGMSSKRVFLLFSIEAILLGFWGSLLGSLAGIGIGKLANRVASDTFLKDLAGFDLTSFPLTSVLAIMLIIMTIAFLAGTLPARRASKKDPIEALRYE
ncbi:MAG TPA: FtsX-like permease family protein [Candidatus Limnocylindria bacterium]|nr:FtsX-like permease family protein [Candidatus Limnocylindria bacterium]